MAFFKKFLFSSLLSGAPALSVGFSNSSKYESIFPKDAELISSSNALNVFKDLENKDQKIQEFLKHYLKTTTGAYDLASSYIRSLLLDFGENWDSGKSSDFISIFKQNLSSYSSGNDKLFSVKEAFLESVRQKLSKELSNIKDSVFDFSNSNDEGLKQLNDFFKYLIEDYVNYKKPIFIRQITWKYSDKSGKIKGILELEESSETPSYFYPFVENSSESDETKWKKFITAVSESKESEEWEKHSDTPDQTYRVLPINIIEPTNSSNYSSQFIVAFLELHGHLLTHSKWSNSSYSSLSKSTSSESTSICADSTSDSIVSLKVDKIKDKTLEDIFCLNKDNLPLKKSKPHRDFFYLKYSNQDSNPKNWIVFKDSKGIHALGLDYSKSKLEINDLLKNFTAKDSKYKFDFVGELVSHLSENFERIIFKKFHIFTLEKDTLGLGYLETKLSPYLQFILDYTYSFNKLKNLRNVLMKDYLGLLKNHKPQVRYKSENKLYETPKIPVSLGFAGNFPYKPNVKSIANVPVVGHINLVFDYLELIYMSKFEKITTDKLNIDSIFNTSLDLASYSEILDSWSYLDSNKPVEYDSKEKIWKYKNSQFSSHSSINNVLNYILIKLQKDSFSQSKANTLLVNLVLKEFLKENLENSNDVKNFKFDNLFNDITKDSFDGKISEDIKETIKRRFLLDRYIDLSNKYSHPALLESPLIGQMSDLKDLTDRYKKLRTFNAPEFDDLISSETKNHLLQFLTLKYLTKNKLENYRLLLKSKLELPRSSGFVYVKKIFGKDNKNANDVFKYDAKTIWELDNPYLGYDAASFSYDPDKLTELSDYYKFTVDSVDGSWSNVSAKTGYVGLYIQGVDSLGLSEDIQSQLNKKLNPITKGTVISYIKILKTHHSLDYFIKKLEQHNSIVKLSEILKLSTSSVFDFQKMSLEQKKKIIVGYLSQDKNEIINTNTHLEIFNQKINDWLSDSSLDEAKLLSENQENQGYINDIETKSKEKFSVFYHQLNIDSLLTQDKFLAFLKKLPSDLICKNLIDLSKQKEIQQQAIWDSFNGSESSSVKKWLIYDENIRNIIDFQFRKIK